ncbi:MAG: hypothetical protein AAFM92_06265 [Pseudomonadota bacterium]
MTEGNSFSIAIITFLAATLVSVMMSSGVPTFLDMLVGLLLLSSCFHFYVRELNHGWARLTLAIAIGGALYLLTSVFVVPILVWLDLATLLPSEGCSADYLTEVREAFLDPCTELVFAGLWLFWTFVAYAILSIQSMEPSHAR